MDKIHARPVTVIDGGTTATRALQHRVCGRRFILTIHARDSYGRLISDLRLLPRRN